MKVKGDFIMHRCMAFVGVVLHDPDLLLRHKFGTPAGSHLLRCALRRTH